ncbi:MAG: glycoside hydrolase family 92 protein [Verrucomicrobia bacterium]|nr:glycoside hydrolase family 92 protein [Verrucomicrobiota bacterium]
MNANLLPPAITIRRAIARVWPAALLCTLPLSPSGPAAEPLQPLWQIGQSDNRAAEFALAPTNHAQFLLHFGSPDHAYYVGLSKPESDWPYVLPGPFDEWAGSGQGGRWDQMNTLPIGFVLEQVSASGQCALTLDLCDTHPQRPPRLRVTVNGANFERDLDKGASDDSMRGNWASGKEQVVRVEFPALMLRPGYNEIALRNTRGSWLVFDALRLEVPRGVKLAAPANTVIRSVSSAPYAVSSSRRTPATVRVEVFRAGSPGKLNVEIEPGGSRELMIQPGVQVFEIAAPASPANKTTHIRLSADGRLLYETRLSLRPSPLATPADYVDVFKGTAHSRWMIAPGPWMPFSMVKISPDNQTQGWCAGYDYTIEAIDCFSHIHEWTMAGLGMMPTIGPLRTKPGLDGAGYSSRFDKATERGGIGFYEVLLKDSGIKVELAATTRASLQRYTFPASDPARVLFDFLLPTEYAMKVLGAKVRRTGPAEIDGTVETHHPELHYNGDQRYDLHFVVQFNRPFDTLGGWQGEQIVSANVRQASSLPVSGASSPRGSGGRMPPEPADKMSAPQTSAQQIAVSGDCGTFVEFKTRAGETILVRAGISLVSVANARLNLERELARPFQWNFDAVVQNQRRVWNELLSRVEIETPDAREKTRFYSNLYRALVGRNIWSDVNGEWIDPEERLQKLADPDVVMLGCDAFWNTFWNLNQVMNLLAPEWSARWVKSQLAMYDKGGWLSKGPAGLEYISVMVAEHEIALLVAAHQHGVKGLDAAKILEAIVKMQTALPRKHPGGGWVGNENLENYLKHGYVASDGSTVGQGTKAEWRAALTSNTFEYAYDDWCVAQMALALGRKDLAEQFLKRSQSWRNVFDAGTGFARPRKANGEWVSPFDPFHTRGFVEGNAWQYTWFVPQDVPGLVNAMGRERFLSRLNEAFEKSAPTRFNAAGERMDLFPINHGNQPSMQASWLFNWAGQPSLSQKWVRDILDAYYGHNPADAYLGDEDQGQMSAWFIMSALGLFQTDGGCRVNPIYELGSPLYPKIVLHLSKEHYGGKTFTIETRNASRENRYIQSAKLNGQALDRWWLRQKEIVKGGRLEVELGPVPNHEWARGCSLPQ